MNKIYSKELFIKNKINTPKYTTINKFNFKKNLIFRDIKYKKIRFPIVLKPVNEGSSLGVQIFKNKKSKKTNKSSIKKIS